MGLGVAAAFFVKRSTRVVCKESDEFWPEVLTRIHNLGYWFVFFFDMSVCKYCAKYNSLEEDSEKKILVL